MTSITRMNSDRGTDEDCGPGRCRRRAPAPRSRGWTTCRPAAPISTAGTTQAISVVTRFPSPRSAPPQAPTIQPMAAPVSAPPTGGRLRSMLRPAPTTMPTTRVDDRRDDVEFGLVGAPDEECRARTDRHRSPEGDPPSTRRVVGERQGARDEPEGERSDERPDHPGEESSTRTHRDVVAVQHDAVQRAEGPEGEHAEAHPPVPDLVEQQVGRDPDRRRESHRDDDGQHRGEDLRLDETPVDEADGEHDRQAELDFATSAPDRPSHRVVDRRAGPFVDPRHLFERLHVPPCPVSTKSDGALTP